MAVSPEERLGDGVLHNPHLFSGSDLFFFFPSPEEVTGYFVYLANAFENDRSLVGNTSAAAPQPKQGLRIGGAPA